MKLKVSGSWKTVPVIKLKVNGAWKNVLQGKLKVSGAWKTFFSSSSVSEPASTVTISQATDSTTKLVTLTGTNYYWYPIPDSLTYEFQWNDGTAWTAIDSGVITNPSSGGSNTKTYTVLNSVNQIVPNIENLYRFIVTSTYNSATNASTSTTTSIQAPRDISTLSAIKNSSMPTSAIDLSGYSSLHANSYRIYYKQGIDSYTQYLPGTTITGTFITILGLNGNTTYTFKVIPVTGNKNYVGYSGNDSNEASATTDADVSFNITASTKGYPGALTAYGRQRDIYIEWEANPAAISYQYRIEASMDGTTWTSATTGSSFTSVDYPNFSTTATSITQSVWAYYPYYRVSVRAVKSNGTFINAANNQFQCIGSAPSGLSVSENSKTSSSYAFNWSLSSNGSNLINNIQYKIGVGGSWVDGGTSSPITISGLNQSTSYTIYVRAKNEDLLYSSEVSHTFTTLSLAPGLPTSLSATTTRTDGVNLTFGGSTDATSYDIFWNTVQGAWPEPTSTPDFTEVSSPLLDTTISSGSTRYYWVRGRNTYGVSSWYPYQTNGVVGTRLVPTTNATPPTSVNATPGNGSVSVSWSGATNAVKYRIWWSTSPTGYALDPSTSYDAETTGTSYTFGGLTNGTTYYFWVSASNTNNVWTNYSASPRGQATPSAPAGSAPTTPSGLTNTYSSGPTWTGSWSASTGTAPITYYWVLYQAQSVGDTITATASGSTTGTSFSRTMNSANGLWAYFTVYANNAYGNSMTATSGWA